MSKGGGEGRGGVKEGAADGHFGDMHAAVRIAKATQFDGAKSGFAEA